MGLAFFVLSLPFGVWQPQLENWADYFSYRLYWRGGITQILAVWGVTRFTIGLRYDIGLERLMSTPIVTGGFYIIVSSLFLAAHLTILSALRRRFTRA